MPENAQELTFEDQGPKKAIRCRSRFRFDGIETGLQVFDLARFLDANRSPLRLEHAPVRRHRASSGHTQKPSSARVTQLNASIEQTIAAADANVAIAFTDRMTGTLCRRRSNSVRQSVLNHGGIQPR